MAFGDIQVRRRGECRSTEDVVFAKVSRAGEVSCHSDSQRAQVGTNNMSAGKEGPLLAFRVTTHSSLRTVLPNSCAMANPGFKAKRCGNLMVLLTRQIAALRFDDGIAVFPAVVGLETGASRVISLISALFGLNLQAYLQSS